MHIEFLVLAISILAGGLGSILGLGGGVIIIPALTLGLGINIRYAVGASIISVIGTSSGAAATYVRDKITNIRLAIFLEIATTLGALAGVAISAFIRSDYLYIIFSLVLLQSAFLMWKRGNRESLLSLVSHPWAKRLKLDSAYFDPVLKKEVKYKVANVPLGFFAMMGAGLLSGLLGIGSGILKVLAMDGAMGLPIKVSSATSNFMMGVTAAASAGAYFMKGDIIPELAAPVALGVIVGSWLGTKVMMILPSRQIRQLFVVVLVIVAIQMGLRGFQHEF